MKKHLDHYPFFFPHDRDNFIRLRWHASSPAKAKTYRSLLDSSLPTFCDGNSRLPFHRSWEAVAYCCNTPRHTHLWFKRRKIIHTGRVHFFSFLAKKLSFASSELMHERVSCSVASCTGLEIPLAGGISGSWLIWEQCRGSMGLHFC